MNVIQLEPEFSRYDPLVTYTLRPGIFHFSNIEFNNKFYVNNLGLRDDEDSLIAPKIVVLGDSGAMGWGVEQEETYAQVIERASGLKVLNAAVSSYGTVREMRIFNRIDTSNLQYLLIHYYPNDYGENKYYQKHNNILKITDEKAYRDKIKHYKTRKSYFPGKYLSSEFHNILDIIKAFFTNGKRPFDEFNNKNEEAYFINAVINAGNVDLHGTRIIVVANDEKFVSNLKKLVKSADYPDYIKSMIIIGLSGKIPADSYYILDEHLNTKGHRAIANEVLKAISDAWPGSVESKK